MNYKNYKSILGAATAIGLVQAAPAFAQAEPATPAAPETKPRQADDTIPDVIVTARRTEERLQDVPISISVLNQTQLTNRNVVNAGDLATFTPSLSTNANFGQENSSFAIRGFVQDQGTPPSVGVYFADVVALRGPTQGTQAGDGAGPGSFFDLQNVQVLKGPQGTLQGRNTTGGAVLFVPSKPTSKLEGYIEGSYGNYDMKRVQGMINIPLGESARFRLAADHMERDGYLRNISGVGPKDYNNINYTAVRASLVVDLTPDLENYTIASFSRSDTNGSVQKLIGCNNTGANATSYTDPRLAAGVGNFIGLLSCGQLARERAAGAGFYDVEAALANPVSQLTTWQAINTTTWKVSDTLTLKNIVSYGQFTNHARSPLFGTNWQLNDLPALYRPLFYAGVPALFTGVFEAPKLAIADQSTFTEEFQIQGSGLGDKLTYQAGAYFEYSGPLGPVGNQSNQLVPCTDLANFQCTDVLGAAFTALSGRPVNVGAVNYTVGRTSFRDVGLYAQANYALTDKLKFTAGFRYTWDTQTNTAVRRTTIFGVTPPFNNQPVGTFCTDPGTTATGCSATYTQNSQAPTWLIDLDYKPTDDILLYAKYSRGYRAGGVFSNAPVDHRTFQPEKVDAYEVGLKSTFRGAIHGTFNVSAFYNDFTNQQLQLGFNPRVDPITGATAPVSPTTAVVNAGQSRIWGVEVESTISPFRGFTIDGSYTYLNAKLIKISPFATNDPNYQVNVVSIVTPAPLVGSPENKFTITGTYTLPLDESIGKISIGATFSHTDSQISTYDYQSLATRTALGGDFGTLQPRDLLNLNASWNNIADSNVDLSVFATNVTGQNYYAWVPGLDSSGAEFAVLGEPRMYGVRLRYSFGR